LKKEDITRMSPVFLKIRRAGLNQWISDIVNEVDHIVYLPRIGSHVLGEISSGMKLGVGFLRIDSRGDFHAGGDKFNTMYSEFSEVHEIKSKLRFIVSIGNKVLSTFGHDKGFVSEPQPGLLFASEDILAHELIAYAWLEWNRKHNTPPVN